MNKKEILDKIGIPGILYSDSEGSFNSNEFVRLINSKKIKHICTNSHAHFIEAFNKTIKQQMRQINSPRVPKTGPPLSPVTSSQSNMPAFVEI